MSLNDRFGPPKVLRAVPDPDALAAAIANHPAGRLRGQRWAERKLTEQAGELSRMPPDSGRNSALNNAAYSCGRLIAGGWLDEQHVREVLEAAALTSGLEHDETLKTLDSGVHAGTLEPRDPPITLDDRPAIPTPPREGLEYSAQDNTWTDTATGEILQPERTSWWPVDLADIIAGTNIPKPAGAFLRRDDGHCLLYAGKVNALIGESESGKSWIALVTVAQALSDGKRVLYLDFEDTGEGIVGRLKLLGVTTAQLANFAYISPDETYADLQRGDLTEHLDAHRPDLIAFDGVNAAMTLLGLDLEKNKDATHFSQLILRPLKRTGACVVTVDHVTKSKENRGSYAIGAQAKRADIDGAGILVEVVQPFGRGMTGRLRLTVGKDRPGGVRAVSSGAKNAGTVVLESTDTAVNATITAPDLRPADERGPFRPTHLMQKVSEYLERVGPDGASKANIESEVTGKREAVRIALDVLVTEGYAESRVGRGGAILSVSIRPYREALDMTSPPRPDLAPTSPRGEVAHAQQTSPPRPPPYRGGEGEVKRARPGEDDEEAGEAWWQK